MFPIYTVWGSEIYNFYNIGKSRQIHFNILPTVYGSESDEFTYVIKIVNFSSSSVFRIRQCFENLFL